jgi:hypothetical protein
MMLFDMRHSAAYLTKDEILALAEKFKARIECYENTGYDLEECGLKEYEATHTQLSKDRDGNLVLEVAYL